MTITLHYPVINILPLRRFSRADLELPLYPVQQAERFVGHDRFEWLGSDRVVAALRDKVI